MPPVSLNKIEPLRSPWLAASSNSVTFECTFVNRDGDAWNLSSMSLVLKSPVRSGFLPFLALTETETG